MQEVERRSQSTTFCRLDRLVEEFHLGLFVAGLINDALLDVLNILIRRASLAELDDVGRRYEEVELKESGHDEDRESEERADAAHGGGGLDNMTEFVRV
ncbi:hypothetical protein HDU85_001241 [Gaertneriomyces sp. JEL0708]|nr:hypothetical protein HDU85_001241 [Gaertneriomyces sp. JEL0708]